jgi:LL-diaminopimelate aminotransferase
METTTFIETAKRLEQIPPYLFARLDEKKAAAIARGVDIINMGIGDPDMATFPEVVEAMHEAIEDPKTHDYPPYTGTLEYRKACVKWSASRFNIQEFDPVSECVSSIGSKEAIHNIFLAFVEPGDYTLIPDPGYPVYNTGTIFAGGTPYKMPLKADNNFLPDFKAIPDEVAAKTKLMFLNYPNNPTSAIAPVEFFEEAVAYCKKHNILLCHDMAYSEIVFDNYECPSIFNAKGAEEVAIEFHSFSKSYNMTGWRAGWVIGNAHAIKALSQVKTNVDSGIFKAIQKASIVAFELEQKVVDERNKIYQDRRDAIVKGLKDLGCQIEPPKSSMFVWAPIPKSYDSSSAFCEKLLDECGIVVSPGNAFGASGEGFFRMALTTDVDRVELAFERLKEAGISFS